MPTAVNILLATSAVSLVSLIGVVFLSVREALLNQLAALLVAFASGGLLGGVDLWRLQPGTAHQGPRGMVDIQENPGA
jgi:hypothetical protein